VRRLSLVILAVGRNRSAVGSKRLHALEGAHDRARPGPSGGQVQRQPSGVAREVPGDMQDG
jgi:hypothetical protein